MSDSFRLRQQFDGNSWSTIYTGSGTSKSRSLSPGDYDFAVKACNGYGCSSYRYGGTGVPPATPSVSTPNTDTNGSFTVSWSGSSGASSYKLQRRKNGGSWSQIYSGSGTSTSQSGLGEGNWDYRVQSCGSGGCSQYSGYQRTLVEFPPPSVTVSSPMTSMNGYYTVSWTTSSGAQRYELEESILSGNTWGGWNAKYTGTATSTEVLNGDGNYRYRVRACKSFACSSWSSISYTEVGTGGSCTYSTEDPVLMSTDSSSESTGTDDTGSPTSSSTTTESGDDSVSAQALPGC